MMKVLLAHGANVNLKSRVDARTAFMYAVRSARPMECALLLLGHRQTSDLAAIDDEGRTVLMHACAVAKISNSPPERQALVEMLLNADADPCAQDKEGKTPLHYCWPSLCQCNQHCTENGTVARMLIDAGADVDTNGGTDYSGRTLLLHAIQQDNLRMIQFCFSRGANIFPKGDALLVDHYGHDALGLVLLGCSQTKKEYDDDPDECDLLRLLEKVREGCGSAPPQSSLS